MNGAVLLPCSLRVVDRDGFIFLLSLEFLQPDVEEDSVNC